jgi:hypothetical protein
MATPASNWCKASKFAPSLPVMEKLLSTVVMTILRLKSHGIFVVVMLILLYYESNLPLILSFRWFAEDY